MLFQVYYFLLGATDCGWAEIAHLLILTEREVSSAVASHCPAQSKATLTYTQTIYTFPRCLSDFSFIITFSLRYSQNHGQPFVYCGGNTNIRKTWMTWSPIYTLYTRFLWFCLTFYLSQPLLWDKVWIMYIHLFIVEKIWVTWKTEWLEVTDNNITCLEYWIN